ncbi:MAG: RsmE family RNA methyltransferase [Actinobacteria bacterium]|nr:RsmE family RNA methyltransferase [Actinomycetota bacterium]
MIETLRRSTAHVFVQSLDVPSLSDDDQHHLLKVLRVKSTDQITVSDGVGKWITATINKDGDVLATSELFVVEPPKWKLCVAFAPVKGEKPELIVQKLTELGIDEIIPLAPTARSVVRWDAAKTEKQTGRLQRVANEASMQSRRVWLPVVHPVTQLADLVSRSEVAFAELGGVEAAHRTIVVGPEGGFAPDELDGSVSRVSLGESVLRAETAAIVAGALMTRCRRGEM